MQSENAGGTDDEEMTMDGKNASVVIVVEDRDVNGGDDDDIPSLKNQPAPPLGHGTVRVPPLFIGYPPFNSSTNHRKSAIHEYKEIVCFSDIER